MRVAVYISDDILSHLPLYCRNIDLAQLRIETLFTQFGHTVVHNRVYAKGEHLFIQNMDVAVIVSARYPEKLIKKIPYKTLVISIDRGDISLHNAVRG